MAVYPYKCANGHTFDVVMKMTDPEVGSPQPCPECEALAQRTFFPVADVWNTEGSHKHSYPKGNYGIAGDKAAIMRRQYEIREGEPAPPPARKEFIKKG